MAAGDPLVDADGLPIVDADGNPMVDNGTDHPCWCCCDECSGCEGDTPCAYDITFDGVQFCGCVIDSSSYPPPDDGAWFTHNITGSLDGTYRVYQDDGTGLTLPGNTPGEPHPCHYYGIYPSPLTVTAFDAEVGSPTPANCTHPGQVIGYLDTLVVIYQKFGPFMVVSAVITNGAYLATFNALSPSSHGVFSGVIATNSDCEADELAPNDFDDCGEIVPGTDAYDDTHHYAGEAFITPA